MAKEVSIETARSVDASGSVYAVSRNGAVVCERGGELVVPWWSFTKTVIASAALTLVRDGRLCLDDALDHQPYTLRQLLQQQAGLPDYGDLPEYHAAVTRGDEPWPVTELLSRIQSRRQRYQPGTGWRYSNVGYLVLRQLIEDATDGDFEAALRRRVLAPLGIEDVVLASKPGHLGDVSMGRASTYHPGWVYHGLLVGPVSSAALLLDRLLGASLLPLELTQQMLHPHVVGGAIEGQPCAVPAYGLGLMCGQSRAGYRFAGHTGSGPGSAIAVYRSMDRAAPASAAVFLLDGTQGEVESAAFDLACR